MPNPLLCEDLIGITHCFCTVKPPTLQRAGTNGIFKLGSKWERVQVARERKNISEPWDMVRTWGQSREWRPFLNANAEHIDGDGPEPKLEARSIASSHPVETC